MYWHSDQLNIQLFSISREQVFFLILFSLDYPWNPDGTQRLSSSFWVYPSLSLLHLCRKWSVCTSWKEEGRKEIIIASSKHLIAFIFFFQFFHLEFEIQGEKKSCDHPKCKSWRLRGPGRKGPSQSKLVRGSGKSICSWKLGQNTRRNGNIAARRKKWIST